MRLFYAMCVCLVVDIDYAMPIDTSAWGLDK